MTNIYLFFLLSMLNSCIGYVVRNAVTDPARLWPQGRVPYVFHDAIDAYRRVHIMAGMKQIMLSTYSGGKQCIYFVPRTNEADYISIQFADIGNPSSHIGRVGGQQNLAIERTITQDHILLAFMFALGIYPEVARPDRDSALQIVTSNIDPALLSNFEIVQNSDTFKQSFDYSTVVMYDPYFAAIDRSLPTITTIYDGFTIGQAVSLSSNDVNLLQHIYRCPLDSSHTIDLLGSMVVECHFHSDFCQFQQDSGDDFDWTLQQGHSSSLGTGPSADHSSGSGFYALASASGHNGQVARLISPSLPAGEHCIALWLFAYGSDVGQFRVILRNDSVDKAIIAVGAQPVNQWYHTSHTFTSTGQSTLRIEAAIGNGDRGDIAIDDVYVYNGRCIDWF